jgi:hypothetical protein
MARRNLRFKENDVSRAIRGVAKAGISVGRVMVDRDGNIVVIASQPGDATVVGANPWDEVLGDATNEKRAS